MIAEIFTITTDSLDQATIVEASGKLVTVERKPCSPKAQFIFTDSPEIRDLLERYERREILNIPARKLLTTRADLYRRARAARGGL